MQFALAEWVCELRDRLGVPSVISACGVDVVFAQAVKYRVVSEETSSEYFGQKSGSSTLSCQENQPRLPGCVISPSGARKSIGPCRSNISVHRDP